MEDTFRMNIAAPNLVNVCVDRKEDNESSGRMYCCYEAGPVFFKNEYQLLKAMESLMERIGYPQSSVEMRSYHPSKSAKQPESKPPERQEKSTPVTDKETVLSQRGEKATFLIHVKYRQSATWQGEIVWVERGVKQRFRSALELLKLMDSADG